ncbi:hypothetical protein [Alkalilacustris brevis]|uniref:hypothetical protein n=1 Tax=Alkalilacustris brevis TaxID=2026338 RepID=UPI00138FC0B4|nr:hypothetical protein [Alkalilacustris brevis]
MSRLTCNKKNQKLLKCSSVCISPVHLRNASRRGTAHAADAVFFKQGENSIFRSAALRSAEQGGIDASDPVGPADQGHAPNRRFTAIGIIR